MNNIQCPALPRDLWVMTLRNRGFSAVDLVHLKRVCRLFREIIQDPSFQAGWKLNFMADFDPMRFKYYVNLNWQQKYNEYALADKERKAEFKYYLQVRDTDVAYEPRRALKWLKVLLERNNESPEECEAATAFWKKRETNFDGELQYYLGCLFGKAVDFSLGYSLICNSSSSGFSRGQFERAKMHHMAFGEYTEAFTLAKCAADQGLAEAQTLLSKFYFEGIGTSVDFAEAFRYAKLAAESGDDGAYYNIGIFYLRGIGTEINNELGMDYLKLAADRGNAEAQHEVGAYYFNAPEPIKDLKKGLLYLKMAGDQGLDKALFNLAKCCYYLGDKTENHVAATCRYLETAAKRGNSDAQYVLEGFVKDKDGKIIDRDCDFRFNMVAAKAGDAVGQLQIAIRYLNGKGIDQSREEALRYFKLAADQGLVEAQLAVGCMEKNENESFKYLKMAADQGNAEGQFATGTRYELGKGTEVNPEEALRYFSMAANKGHGLSLLHLGMLYSKGLGIKQDDKIAFEYFVQAAEKKIPQALYKVAMCYKLGKGIPENIEEALRYLQIAAELRDSDSQYALGKYNLKTPKFESNGLHYLRLAANNGHVKAMYAVAMCYLQGKGTEQDEIKAKQEMLQAAEHGHPKAIQWLQSSN